MAEEFRKAGGATAATRGDKKFKDEWVKLAQKDPKFPQIEHDFIRQTHYDPEAAKIRSTFGVNLDNRSRALREVIWSTAVQHRHKTEDIFRAALHGRKASDVTDRDLIKGIYADRMRLFPKLKKRYESEEKSALKLLK